MQKTFEEDKEDDEDRDIALSEDEKSPDQSDDEDEKSSENSIKTESLYGSEEMSDLDSDNEEG